MPRFVLREFVPKDSSGKHRERPPGDRVGVPVADRIGKRAWLELLLPRPTGMDSRVRSTISERTGRRSGDWVSFSLREGCVGHRTAAGRRDNELRGSTSRRRGRRAPWTTNNGPIASRWHSTATPPRARRFAVRPRQPVGGRRELVGAGDRYRQRHHEFGHAGGDGRRRSLTRAARRRPAGGSDLSLLKSPSGHGIGFPTKTSADNF